MQCKSMDWFLFDKDLRHERINQLKIVEKTKKYSDTNALI